jgi:hypothetical protein
VLEAKVGPYTSVKLSFLAKEVNITEREIRQLLSELILENKIDGYLD